MNIDYSLLVVVLVLLLVLFFMWRAHRDPAVDFNLLDLVMENGRVSKAAFVLMGAFIITTFVIFHMTLNGKMTEGYFTIYGATWIAPVLTRMLSGGATPPEPKP